MLKLSLRAGVVAIGSAVFPLTAAGGIAFEDVSAQAGVTYVTQSGQPTPAALGIFNGAMMQVNMGHGAGVGDYDNDGDLDIYLCGAYQQGNVLLRNNLDMGSKTFTNVTAQSGVGLDDTGVGRLAHFVDLDNDGWLDLLLINDQDAAFSTCKIFKNDGDGTFTDVTAGSGFAPDGFLRCGTSLADYDGDGLLDIYVTVWAFEAGSPPSRFPGHNRLYRNMGGFVFEDVTAAMGLGEFNLDSFTAIFHDIDDDEDTDLHVAVDHRPDRFWQMNSSGTYTEVSQTIGTIHRGNDMGVACADYDDDGDLDIFSTNITDPTGDRCFFGNDQFNCFYENQLASTGTFSFVDRAMALGVHDAYWGWGTEFIDPDQDGDLDLMAVNGFDALVLARGDEFCHIYNSPTVLFENTQEIGGDFVQTIPVGMEMGMDSRALIAFDYDRDGDEDVLVTNVGQQARLFENVSSDQGNWLSVAVVQREGLNRNGIGVTVRALVDGVGKRREILAGESYLAGTPSEVHFGLGDAAVVDRLRVEWTDGSTTIIDDIGANQFIRVEEGLCDCDMDASASVDFFDLLDYLDSWFAQEQVADFDGSGTVDFFDLLDYLDCWFSSGPTCPVVTQVTL